MMVEKKAAGFIVYRLIQKVEHYRLLQKVEYLLLQTSYGIHHWTPPKGHLEEGETLLEAAYRECEEEAGIPREAISVITQFKSTLKYEVNGNPKEVVYWLAKLNNNDFPIKLSREHQDLRWAPVDEACQLVQFDDLQRALRESEAFLTSKK